MKSRIPHSAPTRHRLGEAPGRRFHMSLHPWQAAPFGICLLRISQNSLGHRPLFANQAPLLGELLVWKTSSGPSGMDFPPPATQNRRPGQLALPPPPPPPRSDSVSTTDQSQQTTAPDPGPEEQGTQRPGRARGRGRGLVSLPPRQPHTSQQASGRSGGTSRRAPDWNPLANLANHRSGGWKKDLDFYMGAYFRLNYRQEAAFQLARIEGESSSNFQSTTILSGNRLEITIRSGTSRTWRYNSNE